MFSKTTPKPGDMKFVWKGNNKDNKAGFLPRIKGAPSLAQMIRDTGLYRKQGAKKRLERGRMTKNRGSFFNSREMLLSKNHYC